MTILPLTFLGSTEWYSTLLNNDCIIDAGENYVKQSCRNRCEIMTAAGVVPLSVNVVKGRSIHKVAMRDIRIDYSKRWQHRMWISILSAYKSSPYFDYYFERFEPLFARQTELLFDLDMEFLELMIGLLKVDVKLNVSELYVEASDSDCDLRGHDFLSGTSSYKATPYTQVFAERYPFAGSLSVLDLFFCEGPQAADLLRVR